MSGSGDFKIPAAHTGPRRPPRWVAAPDLATRGSPVKFPAPRPTTTLPRQKYPQLRRRQPKKKIKSASVSRSRGSVGRIGRPHARRSLSHARRELRPRTGDLKGQLKAASSPVTCCPPRSVPGRDATSESCSRAEAMRACACSPLVNEQLPRCMHAEGEVEAARTARTHGRVTGAAALRVRTAYLKCNCAVHHVLLFTHPCVHIA